MLFCDSVGRDIKLKLSSRIFRFLIYVSVVLLGLIVSISSLLFTTSFFEDDVAVAIVMASFSGFVAVVSVVVSKSIENREAIKQAIRKNKVLVYEELMGIYFRTFFPEVEGRPKEVSEEEFKEKIRKEIIKDLRLLMPRLITWSNEDVLVEFKEIRKKSLNGDSSLMFSFEKMM